MSGKILPEIRVGDLGTSLQLEVLDTSSSAYDPEKDCKPPPKDLTGATELEMIFERPDGTSVEVTATVVGPATDGIIEFLTTSGFLNIPGQWRRQGRVKFATTEHKTSIVCFPVLANIGD